ncbi:MAG TPA: hypothetical protein VGT61_11495 [Thermomicrobiales bacterium]|jgi:hypothetical protein|nr:hypothetical protein [Thermomicrobiales bacterium]
MTRRHVAGSFIASATGRLRLVLLSLVLVAVLSVSAVAGAFSRGPAGTGSDLVAQDATPAAEETTPEPTGEAVEVPDDATSGASDSEINGDEPTAAIVAHGLAYWPGGEAVWRVREINVEPDFASEPAPFFGIVVQREGASIIRNDLTNKRARLEAGEAYYISQADPYTLQGIGETDSVAWLIELTEPDAPVEDGWGGEVAFESDPVDIDEATFDAELSRNVLLAGESGQVFAGNGPTLILGSTSQVTVDPGDGTTLEIGPAEGVTVASDAIVENGGSDPAVYLTAALRDEIIDPVAPTADAAATPEAAGTPAGDTGDGAVTGQGIPEVAGDDGTDSDGDGLTDAQEAAAGSDAGVIDTDADGIDDFTELNDFGTDPTNSDTDGDGLLDGDEVYIYSTDQLNPDTDGDGASDAAEVEAGTDPFDPSSTP